MNEPSEPSDKSSGSLTGGQATVDRDANGKRGQADTGSSPTIKGRDFGNVIELCLLTCAGSLLIVVYVLVINSFTAHRQVANVVDNAALLAARELSEITVQRSNFGEVGLCDLAASRFAASGISHARVIGIDRLYDTLEVDQEVAEKLGHPLIKQLVSNDKQIAQRLERELAQRLKQAVEPDASQANITVPSRHERSEDQDNNVYRDVYKAISADREAQQASSVTVDIKLGQAKSAILTRDCEPRLIDSHEFFESSEEHAPYLVLLRVVYERRGKSGEKIKSSRESCALVAAPDVEAPPSAFVINFPAAVPPSFQSPHDILFYQNWKASGDWQQAVGSDVPGKGSLAPPLGSVMPSMSPGDAMAFALYDWLKSAGASVDPDRAVELIGNRWDTSPLFSTEASAEDQPDAGGYTGLVNSCLARDTGAREYSVMNQTGPGSSGQTALRRAFSIVDENAHTLGGSIFPQSALPLRVDSDGKCNLAGRRGFDRALVESFLTSLHATNIAAISSHSTADQITAATSSATSQLEQKMYIERQELASLTGRLSRMQDEGERSGAVPREKSAHEDSNMHFVRLAKERVATLNAVIGADESERRKFARMQTLALLSSVNSARVADSTFELGAHALKLCRKGIYKVDAPQKGFLIGSKLIFTPITTALTEADFADSAELAPRHDSPAAPPRSPWFQNSLNAVFNVGTEFDIAKIAKVDGVSLREFLRRAPERLPVARGMIVLSSPTVERGAEGAPAPRGYGHYVFENIPIPPGQLLYYCQNAMETGADPKVSWSVLLRDVVASKASASGEEPVGSPIISQQKGWCDQNEAGACPGLACELQIRSPLPILTQFSEDSYLRSPSTRMQVPQIPPVPPDML